MSNDSKFDPISMLRPKRKLTGYSAILLPFLNGTEVDWESFDAHIERTVAAGLIPAVNMDTGYINLIDDATKSAVLEHTQKITGNGPFCAGAFVLDEEGDSFNKDVYAREMESISTHGGTPVIFQSFGLTQQSDDEIVKSYQYLGTCADQFIGFELGTMFAPFGKVYSIDVYREMIQVPCCIGAKHSSFQRNQEWERIRLRDEVRPDFKVFTGNDHAIDMVMYGSDYLLGLSTFCPDLFGKRDAYWENGDPAFYQLNDVLQYLGYLTFRNPVPGYKHSAAQFLNLRGWTKTDLTHPNSPKRPNSDREVLKQIGPLLGIELGKV